LLTCRCFSVSQCLHCITGSRAQCFAESL
jgi:hypothetical protein